MIVIDSSLWIEHFEGSKNGRLVQEILESNDQIVVPSIIITEIYKKILSETDETTANDYIAQFQEYKIVNLDFYMAIQTAKNSKELKLPLADAIIYSTAQTLNAMLFTMDRHFMNLQNVKYIEKN